MNNVDPVLGPLDDYGGPTPTMPLLAGSPAIDGAGNAGCLATDQRGRARPYGAACDIGAFESSAPFVIRGHLSGNTLVNEVLVTNSASSSMTLAGNYSLSCPPGTYAVTPVHPDYLFLPNYQTITVGPDRLNVNFKGYRWNALSIEDTTNHTLHLIFAQTNGLTYRLLASPDLFNWIVVSTNVVGPTNYIQFFEPMNQPRRFYRTVTP